MTWFGGKSRACSLIHPRLGNCPGYIEPFAGSLAYLLFKPASRYETVNDLDNYIANFWRAVKAVDARVRVREAEGPFGRKVRMSGPDAVAFYADWPVNEADLTARHRWLMARWRKYEFRERMLCEPEYFDAKVAGYWVWGISCWIGAGWCDERSEWNGPGREGNRGRAMHQEPKRPEIGNRQGVGGNALRDPWEVMPFVAGGKTVHKQPSPTPEMMAQSERGVAGAREPWVQVPRLSGHGQGVTKAGVRPDLARDGKGVNQRRPHLGHGGGGAMTARDVPEGRPHLQRHYEVHKPPHIIGEQMPRCNWTNGVTSPNRPLLDWMQRLADRLRYVRVCCGDWSRIMGKAVRTAATPCAILLDPPYSAEAGRAGNIYATEDLSVAHDVRKWCIDHGDDPNLRIALCGYEGEGHDALVADHGWTVEAWKASGGYGRIHGDKAGRSLTNRHRERVWFSPHCLRPDDPDAALPTVADVPPGSTLFQREEAESDG